VAPQELVHTRALIVWGSDAAVPPAFLAARRASEQHDLGALNRSALELRGILAGQGSAQIIGPIIQEWRSALSRVAGTPAEVAQRHRSNVDRVNSLLSAMSSSGSLVEANTAEFLRQRARLVVLTPTHDSGSRAIALGGTVHNVAYVGADHAFPSANAHYDLADPRSPANVHLGPEPGNVTAESFPDPNTVRVLDPWRHPDAGIRTTLMHETQHLLDRSADEHITSGSGLAAEAWVSYKTEFRARWVSGEFAHLSDSPLAGENPRRAAIQDDIIAPANGLEADAGYRDVTMAYRRDLRLPDGRAFRTAVRDYHHPDSVNMLNSIRIDDLYSALGRVEAGATATSRPVLALLDSISSLTPADLAYVNSGSAWRLQNSIGRRCRGPVLAVIARALGAGSMPSWSSRAASQPPWTNR
jgi:hypothetical protein